MKRRRKHKQNCITDIDFIQDKAFQFIIKNDEYLELDLEEINVEDLLGLIYRKQESEENLTA